MSDKDAQEKISQLQLIEQSVQQLLQQKQQFQSTLSEVESALGELEKSNESYKIVGNIMIKTNKDDLLKELKEKQESMNIRIKAIEKQESQLKEKADAARKEIMDKLKE